MTKLSLACGLVLSAALAACSTTPPASQTATTAAPVATTATTTASAKGPKLVCEDSNQMGSHMQQHICLTPEQVAQRHKDSQQAAQDMQNRAHAVSADGKPPA
ncbi:MAG TPA: hypothetical protein VH327_07990 [Gammaproteobacteria bacterium]|jgi:membrane-bound lytic murein transglycosylase|nr:hypothetical protein [Gammaproteobacteria bacterium]